jgi:hypothetical protein
MGAARTASGLELPVYLAHVEQAEESPAQAWRRSCRPAEGPKAAYRALKALLAGETPAHHLPKVFARKACQSPFSHIARFSSCPELPVVKKNREAC